MDILNFISWIKGRRYVTSADPASSLLPVALKDDRRDDSYLTAAISVQNFATQVAAVIPAGAQGPQGPQGVPGPPGPPVPPPPGPSVGGIGNGTLPDSSHGIVDNIIFWYSSINSYCFLACIRWMRLSSGKESNSINRLP